MASKVNVAGKKLISDWNVLKHALHDKTAQDMLQEAIDGLEAMIQEDEQNLADNGNQTVVEGTTMIQGSPQFVGAGPLQREPDTFQTFHTSEDGPEDDSTGSDTDPPPPPTYVGGVAVGSDPHQHNPGLPTGLLMADPPCQVTPGWCSLMNGHMGHCRQAFGAG